MELHLGVKSLNIAVMWLKESKIRHHMVSRHSPAGSSVLLAVVVGGAIGISVARRDIAEGEC